MSTDIASTRKNQHRTAQTPARPPRVRGLSVLVGIALLALAVVAIREAVVVWRAPDGWAPLISRLPEILTGLGRWWVAGLGVAAVLAGLFFLVAAVSPRAKRYRPLDHTDASIWVRPVDIARLSTATAKRIPGVVSASSLSRKNRVTVNVTAVDATEDLRRRIGDELDATLSDAFGPGLNINVGIREADLDDGVTPRLTDAADAGLDEAAGHGSPAATADAVKENS